MAARETLSEAAVRAVIHRYLGDALQLGAERLAAIHDSTDLIDEGVLDSLLFVNLIGEIEDHFGIELDLADLDPEAFTRVGGLIRHTLNGAA